MAKNLRNAQNPATCGFIQPLNLLEGQRKILSMRQKLLANVLVVVVILPLLTSIVLAVVERETVRYEQPVRVIRGRVTSLGHAIQVVWVDVYDNAQVRLDDSLAFAEQRRRQTKVASAEPNEEGEFKYQAFAEGVIRS